METKDCRACCSRDLVEILSLGDVGLSDFVDLDYNKPIEKYPLDLILCSKCSLLQLKHTVKPALLYNDHYGYRSGINQTMRDELKNITAIASGIVNLSPGDVVLDIGSNDGTLLKSYPHFGIHRIGFEPIKKFANETNTIGMLTVNDFFNRQDYQTYCGTKKAKIITAISMFYDLEDPNKFISDIADCLDEQGILVIQQNYLKGMFKQNAFDNIVHEHLEYYSLTSMESLLGQHGLKIFDVTQNNINGGSFRTYISHFNEWFNFPNGYERVKQMKQAEKSIGFDTLVPYQDFANRVKDITLNLSRFIYNEAAHNKEIYVYGASTRGNTLLQACALDSNVIIAAAERNPEKWGKKMSATNIPIISEEEARADKPDYFLVLPWFFKDEFIQREQEYLKNRGRLIFPLPVLEVV